MEAVRRSCLPDERAPLDVVPNIRAMYQQPTTDTSIMPHFLLRCRVHRETFLAALLLLFSRFGITTSHVPAKYFPLMLCIHFMYVREQWIILLEFFMLSSS
jgi:hypothetical protein